jgi:hypothetical protein
MKHAHCQVAMLIFATTVATTIEARSTVAAYPSGHSVPENLLRIELRFSKPLNSPLDMDRIKLLDEDGQEIADAFLGLSLPSANGQRVTLLLHPGRVKSGVGANRRLGRALVSGSLVTLAIDDPTSGSEIQKTWRVIASSTASITPGRWKIDPLSSGTRLPLTVHLNSAISSAADSLIAVQQADGKRLAGVGYLGQYETVWRFIPLQPWRAGRYSLVTHPDLEDPSGNRVCSPFELKDVSHADCQTGTTLLFEIK